MRLMAALAAALTWLPAPYADTYTFVYRMEYGGLFVGNVTDTLVIGDDVYSITSVAEAEGLAALVFGSGFTRVSEGAVTDGKFRPVRYSQSYDGDKSRTAQFDWDAGMVRLNWPEGEREVPMEDGGARYHDRLSFLYQPFISCTAEAGTYRVTDGKRISSYRYEVAVEERDSSVLGKTGILRLSRISDSKPSVMRLASRYGLAPLSFETASGGGYRFDLTGAEGVDVRECG